MKCAVLMVLVMATLAACKNEDCAQPNLVTNQCIDTSVVALNDSCTEEFAPVCGCDGITYDNACKAREAGVTAYNTGACCQK